MKLDQAVVDRLRQPLLRTWNEIGYELQDLAESDGGRSEEHTSELQSH